MAAAEHDFRRKKVLVVGASGLVGSAAVRRFSRESSWEVVGVARRIPPMSDGVSHVQADLTDRAACDAAFGAMVDVTHLVFSAVHERPGLVSGWFDPVTIAKNAEMLRNVIEPLASAADLRHVSLLQGTKAYGVHRGLESGPRVPLREIDEDGDHPNFYFEQEQFLRSRQAEIGYSITVLRPTVIYGDAAGTNMNPLLPLAVYGSLLRVHGEPLHFPGKSFLPTLHEAVDADLVADALCWAAVAPEARDRAFNVTNGDVFCWPDVWPSIAAALDMEPGQHRPLSLAEELPRRRPEWAALVERHELRAPRDLVHLVGENSLTYADMTLSGATGTTGRPVINSTIAIRQAGFNACIDTEEMFVQLLHRLQADRIIPPTR